jgi:hypothetical protein
MKESAQPIVTHVMTTQAWAQRAGAWQQVSFQATNLEIGRQAERKRIALVQHPRNSFKYLDRDKGRAS